MSAARASAHPSVPVPLTALATRSTTVMEDVDVSFTAGYGNTLSWAPGSGPGMGERPVTVVHPPTRKTFDWTPREPDLLADVKAHYAKK